MGLEKWMKSNPEETASGLTPEQIRVRFIQDEMKGKGLSPHHARNILSTIGLTIGSSLPNIPPAERYTDRVRREAREQGEVENGELYMQLSNPEAVAEFDALIDSFNANREEIDKNSEAAQAFKVRASEILRKYNV